MPCRRGSSLQATHGTMRPTLLLMLLCSTCAVYARTAGSAPPQASQNSQLAARAMDIARTPLDVRQTTCDGYLCVGAVWFVWKTGSSLFQRTAFEAGLKSVLLATTFAGFTGGRGCCRRLLFSSDGIRVEDILCTFLGAAAAGVTNEGLVLTTPWSICSICFGTLAAEIAMDVLLAPSLPGPAAQVSNDGAANGRSLRHTQESARELARHATSS